MSDLVLYRDGQPVDLNDYPSLLAALHASDRAVRQIDEEIARIEAERAELGERIRLHEEIGLPTRAPKAKRTRLGNRVGGLKRRRRAHQMNYLEVPDMGGQLVKHYGDGWWDERRQISYEPIPTDVPMDVLRALKHAKEQEVFDEFRIYTPASAGTDPMIVGVVDGASFYVASWR